MRIGVSNLLNEQQHIDDLWERISRAAGDSRNTV